MSWATIEVTAKVEHADEKVRVRANLKDAGPVMVNRRDEWEFTGYQIANASNMASDLAYIGGCLLAAVLEIPEDNLKTTWEDISAICDVADVLMSHGEKFSGGDRVTAEKIAADWLNAEFTANGVESWACVGVWDAAIAASLRDAGMAPDNVLVVAAKLTKESDDPDE